MQQKELNVELRSENGKGVARRLRGEGRLPGVVYGKGMESVSVSLQGKELLSAVAGEGGHNNLITLKGGGELNGKVVIVADLTRDPLKGTPIHVDLHKISMTEKVRIHVPIRVVGTALGVREGGILDLVMHELEIDCLPTQIPEHLDVDVTALTIGHSIHLGDLVVPAGVHLHGDKRASVVSVLGRTKEEPVAAAEGAAPAAP
ncbi:MAG TPA: 50S ribosomal protein L25 [Geobacterales bacterium]|nr:50S ribosomal protein L25 [Geobacterales bacterium]